MEKVKTRHGGLGAKLYTVPQVQKSFIRGVLGLFSIESQSERGNMVIYILDNLCDVENSRLSDLIHDGMDCFEDYTAFIGTSDGDWIRDRLLTMKAACVENEFYEMAANITSFIDMADRFKSVPHIDDLF